LNLPPTGESELRALEEELEGRILFARFQLVTPAERRGQTVEEIEVELEALKARLAELKAGEPRDGEPVN
jgi:hypothetical protein